MKAKHMQAWTRGQRGEPLHEFQRGYDDMSGTVPVGTFELQHHLASTIALEPFPGVVSYSVDELMPPRIEKPIP